MGKHTSNEEREKLIFAVFRKGRPVKEAAEVLGIKYHTATNICRKFRYEDRCFKLKHQGPSVKFGKDYNRAICELVSNKSTITLKQCQQHFREKASEYNNKIPSISTINRIMIAEGFTFKDLQPVPIERNSPSTIELRRRYAIKYSGLESRANFVFLDEFGCNLSMRRNKGRSLVGRRAFVQVSGKRGANLSVCAALDINGPIHYMRKLNAFDAVNFMTFLEELIEKLPTHENMENFLIMDNVAFHKTNAVQNLLKSMKIKFFYLPPYSPMLNPIEECFSKVKTSIKRAESNSNFELYAAIDDAFKAITPSDCVGWFRHTKEFFTQCLTSQPIYCEADPRPNQDTENGSNESYSFASEDELISALEIL